MASGYSATPLMKGAGRANQTGGDLLHTMAGYGLPHVRTELQKLLVIPSLAPHPIHANRQLPGHGDLGDLPSSAHRQVEVLAAPFRVAAYRDLRRFYQQKAQQRVALFGNVP